MLAASSKASLVALVALAGCGAAAGGKTRFLQMEPSRPEIDGTVDADLSGNITNKRLADVETGLRTIYMALPKLPGGGLGHQAVRYALHRFFVQRHGWYIRGIEPKGDTFSKLSPVVVRKDWIAAYVQSRFEEHSGRGSLDLKGLASLAIALEDIVSKEASMELKEVYKVLDHPVDAKLGWEQAQEVLQTYFMVYLNNQNITVGSPSEARLKLSRFQKRYSGWSQASAFLDGVEGDLRGQPVDFPAAVGVVTRIGERFSNFNEGECKDMKQMLMGMEVPGQKAGRIRLVDLYNKSLYSHWRFTEKADYLRELGALDETNASQPLLIMPNYLSAFSNCLRATSLYAVCCQSECEGLMGHLESKVASPTAPAERIAQLVASLGSSTVAAPRELPARLLGRLRELADAHGGEVHLHSRLFAQWMHHAYPRECPYPHEAGTTNPVSVDEFTENTGKSAHVSEEEMRQLVADACPIHGCSEGNVVTKANVEPELPWSNVEELLAVTPRPSGGARDGAAWLLAALPVLALGWWLLDRRVMSRQQRQKLRLVLALSAVLVVLRAADLLDATIFLPVAFCALLFGGARHAFPAESVQAKGEKCCV